MTRYKSTFEPGIPWTPEARKQTPVASGVLAYFPHSTAEVAKVSYIGNDQHNPGQPLHWAREKSTDQMDAAARHIMEYLEHRRLHPEIPVPRDEKGNALLAQAIWRLNAQNELDIERARRGGPVDASIPEEEGGMAYNPVVDAIVPGGWQGGR